MSSRASTTILLYFHLFITRFVQVPSKLKCEVCLVCSDLPDPQKIGGIHAQLGGPLDHPITGWAYLEDMAYYKCADGRQDGHNQFFYEPQVTDV